MADNGEKKNKGGRPRKNPNGGPARGSGFTKKAARDRNKIKTREKRAKIKAEKAKLDVSGQSVQSCCTHCGRPFPDLEIREANA